MEPNGPLMRWGLPADDQEAATALEHQRADDFSYLVFPWPAYWWIDHYIELTHSVRKCFPCTFESKRVIVFSLKSWPAISHPGT